jgi:hypothetical protein
MCCDWTEQFRLSNEAGLATASDNAFQGALGLVRRCLSLYPA